MSAAPATLPPTALAAVVWAAEAHHGAVAAAIAMAVRVSDSAESSIRVAREAQRAAGTAVEHRAADAMLEDGLALLTVAEAGQAALAAQLVEAELRRGRAHSGLWCDAMEAKG